MTSRRTVALAASVAFLLSSLGCTSARILPTEYMANRDALLERVKPGDVVFVTDEGGERHRMKVESNDGTSISGESMEFNLAHVTKIETLQFDPVRSAGLGVALAYVIYVAVITVATVLNPPVF